MSGLSVKFADRAILVFETDVRLKKLSAFNKSNPPSKPLTDEDFEELRRLQSAWAEATNALFEFDHPDCL
ncbi:MAG TPA: hypothetical protein VKR52_13380 [Terracidiphilus sp.]|nr:hypothetical protein [Terracidiphilus sp.]